MNCENCNSPIMTKWYTGLAPEYKCYRCINCGSYNYISLKKDEKSLKKDELRRFIRKYTL
jgi:hypothetical protein